MLNIAIIGSRGYPSTYGGYETLVRYLASFLVERGHSVTVYCRTPKKHSRIWYEDGVRCIHTPGIDTKSLSTLSYGFSSTLEAAIRGVDCALVLNIANGFFLPALRLRHIPTAVNTDGIEWERGKWGPVAREIFLRGGKMTARHADMLIADSEAIGDIWLKQFGAKSVFIPYGGELILRSSDERIRELGLESARYVLAVARLIPENNVELFLDALERSDWAWPTVVVGSANFDAPIERRLKELDRCGSVRWLGHVHDQELLIQLWANAGTYVHGHSVGGTNPALIQALGAGAPTIALDTVFNQEVLANRQQLYPNDPDALGKLIDRVMSSADLQAELRARGQRIVSERYEWTTVCERYAQILERIAEHK